MDRSEFRYVHRLRVRWSEVDAQQIVFFPNYLVYCNVGSIEWWRAVGVAYPGGFEAHGGDLFLKKASIEYHGSARYDDELEIGFRCSRIGNSSLTVSVAVFRGDELLASVELTSVFANQQTRRPMPIPVEIRAAIEAFEQRTF